MRLHALAGTHVVLWPLQFYSKLHAPVGTWFTPVCMQRLRLRWRAHARLGSRPPSPQEMRLGPRGQGKAVGAGALGAGQEAGAVEVVAGGAVQGDGAGGDSPMF